MYFGALLWGIGFEIVGRYYKNAKKYRINALSTAYKKVDAAYNKKGKIPKEELLSRLDNVLLEFSQAKDDSNAPKNLLIIFLIWGVLSIIVGLTWESIPTWISAIMGSFAFVIGGLFVLAVRGLLRMIKE